MAMRGTHLFSTLVLRFVLQSGSTFSILVINHFFGADAVAVYSACLAAILMTVIVFRNGLPVLLLRYHVSHPRMSPDSIAEGFQATLFRSPRQYAIVAVLSLAVAGFLYQSIGADAVHLFVLMSPLILILPILTLMSSQYKAKGQTIRASLYEIGSVHLGIALLILIAISAGVGNFTAIFVTGFVLSGLAGGWTLLHFLRKTRNTPALRAPAAQRKILVGALLLFASRNGFPLFFAAFMFAGDLGQFRLEERLFFLVMFFYMLFETVGMKRFIAGLRPENPVASIRFYKLSACAAFAIGLAASLVLFGILQFEPLTQRIGYAASGTLTVLMALAMPFYFLALYNNTVLNLLGLHGAVNWGLLLGAASFFLGAYLLYADMAVDGIRIAYLCGGIVSSIFSGTRVLLAYRSAPNPPTT